MIDLYLITQEILDLMEQLGLWENQVRIYINYYAYKIMAVEHD